MVIIKWTSMYKSIKEKCKIIWIKGTDWNLEIKGDCTDILSDIDKLPDRRKNYLKRRIVC